MRIPGRIERRWEWFRQAAAPAFLLSGVWLMFTWIERDSNPRRDAIELSGGEGHNLGAQTSAIVVPEALAREARAGVDRFRDYDTYAAFLTRGGLERSVLAVEVSSLRGGVIYHMFPALIEPDTFDQYIVGLPALVSERRESADRPRLIEVFAAPAEVLVDRTSAESALHEGELFDERYRVAGAH